jgi:hypothetical protein
MDDDSKQLLNQLVTLQSEQNELLRKYLPPLWTRIRFSLLALLTLMTLVAVGLGIVVIAVRSKSTSLQFDRLEATELWVEPTR